jgi:hypothetical protein
MVEDSAVASFHLRIGGKNRMGMDEMEYSPITLHLSQSQSTIFRSTLCRLSSQVGPWSSGSSVHFVHYHVLFVSSSSGARRMKRSGARQGKEDLVERKRDGLREEGRERKGRGAEGDELRLRNASTGGR